MNLHEIKYHTCPVDEEDAILLVDVETEAIPSTDAEGNIQYYCPSGSHTFSVDEDGVVVESESQTRR